MLLVPYIYVFWFIYERNKVQLRMLASGYSFMTFSNKIFTINKKNVLRIKQLLVKFSCSIPKIMKYAFLFGSNAFVVPPNSISFTDTEGAHRVESRLSGHLETTPG